LLYRFFFSIRRRHTRFSRDWSSDVCSSDLCWRRCCCPTSTPGASCAPLGREAAMWARSLAAALLGLPLAVGVIGLLALLWPGDKIGRASCREREWSRVDAGVVDRR